MNNYRDDLGFPRRARALLMVYVSLVPFVGCAAQQRAAPPASRVVRVAWPPRITAGLKQLATNTPHVFELDQVAPSRSSARGAQAEHSRPAVDVVRSIPSGLGIVLELRQPDGQGDPLPTKDIDLAFVSFSPLAEQAHASQTESDRPTESAATSARRLPERITPRDLRAGVTWHLYMPSKPPPRGLVVHLGGNKYVRRALLKRGWAVLNSAGTGRFFQHRTSPLIIEPGNDLDDVAARIASRFDDELADWPYSLEAVLEYLGKYHPEVPQKPAVVMGFSIGNVILKND